MSSGGHNRINYHHSEETIKKMKLAQKGEKNFWFGKPHKISLETRKKISNTLLSHKVSLETRKKMREKQLKNPNKSRLGTHIKEETRIKIREARKKQIHPKRDTTIEIKIQDFLKLYHIEFIPHYYISEITHSYQCDILIPSIKTIIECDGCYWHGCEICNKKFNSFQIEQIEKDKIRTQELIKKGYRVIRLWEHDIQKMEINEFKDELKK